MVSVGVVRFHLFSLIVIKMAMEIIQTSCENTDIDTCSDRNLSNLEYTDVVVLLREDSSNSQVSSIV